MHIEGIPHTVVKTILSTFTDNAFVKFIFAGSAGLIGLIANGNEQTITAIIFLYIIDLVTGTIKAMKNKELQSAKFFTGATKLLVYGIFLVIAGSIDSAIGIGSACRWAITVYIITTDSISILENLDELGFATPMFLKKYLKTAQKGLDKKLNIKSDEN